jgi:hypothetical protein
VKFHKSKTCRALLLFGALLLSSFSSNVRAEALLQLFNVSYVELIQKMPELAEAGYTSIWLPPPTKGSGGLSVGYDMWDPFDFGQKDQRNTVRTRYGTEAELLQMMEVAHRFGIRVYFDNIMNHRSFDIPGYNEDTPTGGEGQDEQDETYPGMVPEDFHLQKTEDGFYRKWNNTRDWNSAWQVQNLGLADLIDIAQESGNNLNFGTSEGSTHPKYGFVRDLNRPEQYDKDKDGNTVYFGWLIDRAKAALGANATAEQLRDHAKAYILENRSAYVEYVEKYLERAVRWKIDRLKADGLRLDAVKHVPDYFFGKQSGADKDTSNDGYLGEVQWQFNRTRGFSDANHRDSIFNDKRGRDDAMVFGEHLGQPPGYNGYWDAGMRLVDNDLRSKLNSQLGNPWGTLAGLDSPGAGGFSASLGVTHANSHDSDYAAQKELQHAHYMFREGIGLIYSDGYYKAATLGESGGAFPRHANTQFLGQFSDPRIPNILKLHNDFARGLQQGRWGDSDYMAYERRDNRNKIGDTRNGTASEEITMVAMFNDNTAQGQARPISTSFWSGAYLYQYAEGPNGSFMGGFYKYAGELGSVVVPPGGYYVFGWRTPELSTLWPNAAITLYQGGQEVDRITVTRKDGPDGDKSFNPYGLPNRGYPVGTTPPDYTYRTTVPVVKSGNFTIIARADGSAENIVLKLDGGVDLNGTRPVGNTDPAFRDHPPGIFSDVWMGYEQPLFVERQFAEKFAAQNTVRCQIGSPGAETYVRTISGGGTINNGPAAANNYGTDGGNQASFVYHDPAVAVAGTAPQPLQFDESGANIVIWAESNAVGSGFKAFVYYTVDGSFPEGAGGIGRGTTRVAEMNYQRSVAGKDWWASIGITKPAPGTTLTYKIGFYKTVVASQWPSGPTEVARKKNMLTTFSVADFNPATKVFFPHNDYARTPTLNTAYTSWPWATQTGLSEGFHVLRARAHLNRNPDTSAPLYQTFTQVFYYDAARPTGQVLFPATNGDTVGGSSYELVVQTDRTVEELWFNIADSDNGNNDSVTKILNGNGPGFEPFVDANQNGTRESGEEYTDINANGQYDASLAQSWGQATQVTSVNLPDKKEWRFRYNNIPSTGTATITIRLLEASSSRNLTLPVLQANATEITRNVETRGPDQRVNIAWPQRDGDRVDDNYTMKVYFTKSLANDIPDANNNESNTDELINRFTFSIASTESGTDRGAVVQSRDNFTINYNVNDTFHELSIPLPNMYNDVADFLHTLKVTYTFPDNRKLDAIRLVKANPSTKPFVRITRPTELGSDGRQTEIILPDVPNSPEPGDVLDYVVRVETSAAVNDLALSGTPSINFFTETFTDTNGNGKWDAQEPSTDKNSNGVLDPAETFTDSNGNGNWDAAEPFVDANNNGTWNTGETFTDLNGNGQWDAAEPLVDTNNNGLWDSAETYSDVNNNGVCDAPGELFSDTNGNGVRDPAEPFTDTNNNGSWDGIKVSTSGNTKTWDFTWRITAPATYVLKATATLGSQVTETVRNARVILRQITGTDGNSSNDDDEDGLVDVDETNKKDLPEANAETYSNGDVHIWRASGLTLPNSPDSDGDLLPDGLEVGWRLANTNVTDVNEDTNGDGFKNFIGDLDPPFYAVVGNNGKVPGVGSLNQGDDRTRQAAGSVTDPTNPDTDSDGISDGVEDANRNGWVDGDGASIQPTWEPWLERAWPNNKIEAGETWTETSPTKSDSDEDGLSDGYGEDKNLNGFIDGDSDKDRDYDPGETWSETNPLKSDTDGDGLPDGWETQYGLDALDNGTTSMRTGGAGNPNNGASGDPDNDGFTNTQELASGTHPNQPTTVGGGGGEGPITIGTFTQWKHTDLLVLDEYNESNSNGAADVYRSNNDTDTSRDIVAFSFRDGGDLPSGDGRLYFRIDFMDLAANAWQGEVDAYIVIDTGNPNAGERSIPNEVDIATDMKWEAVIAVYGQNFGNIFVDRNVERNTTTQTQNPVTAGGVEARSFGGRNEAAWSSRYDAVEIAVERQQLKDAGWLGDPNTLNFQVFTTKPNTQNGVLGIGVGSGDLGGRNDIRDTIYDDKLSSDWWRDQDDIILNGKLSGYFGRSGSNDRNKYSKVMLLAHGNQAIQPASVTQALVRSGTPAVGYSRLLQTHEAYNAPLTLHLTPTLASALQWAVNPSPGAWPNNDGPSFNAKLQSLISAGRVALLGSTFSDHVPKYFPQNFNNENKALGENFLDGIYGSNTASRSVFWPPERILDTASLDAISGMGYSYTFADQMKHFVKWFGRTSALGESGYRINEVNGLKILPIHDEVSTYLEQTRDEGSTLPVRQLLSRRSRSNVQDQVVVLWKDMGDFSSDTKATSYDTNVRWLASRPWIRVVTAQQIAGGQVQYPRLDNGQLVGNWGTINRDTAEPLAQTAKDWLDWASGGNYDNWYNGSTNEQGLRDRTFGTANTFGRVGDTGNSQSAWLAASGIPSTIANSTSKNPVRTLAQATLHAAMFQTAFHNTPAGDLSKFSTGDYIKPDNGTGQTLADFARFSQSQARFAKVYERVQQWNSNANSATLGAETADVDLDGQNEYLLFNSRVFAVFEGKGGRMTAAWIRHHSTKQVWQVAGNFAAYSNTDTEDEGASNLVGTTTTLSAYRTSGFKDWWTVTGTSGSSASVNATYVVTEAPPGVTGWKFTQGGISKTITLPNTWSGNLSAEYTLSGLSKLYVRFGLSPNLLDLMINGQNNLVPEQSVASGTGSRLNLLNNGGTLQTSSDDIRAFLIAPQINGAASDKDLAGFTTVTRRNQAQTHQVEVELTGSGPHFVTLGFDQGTDFTEPMDFDSDGIPDAWERTYNNGDIDSMTQSTDGDGDGLLDIEEYVMGSNPNDASSGPMQPQTSKTAEGFQVSFPTIAGRVYTVKFRDNLGLAAVPLTTEKLIPGQSNPIYGDGTTKSVTDITAAAVSRRFYEVEVSLPTPSP